MSTAFIPTDAEYAPPSGVRDLAGRIRALITRRRQWQSLGLICCAAAAVFLICLATGIADAGVTLSLGFRRVSLGLMIAVMSLTVSSALWRLLRRRSLHADARELQIGARRFDNAIVTVVDRAVLGPAVPEYLAARLEGQAARSLDGIDPRRLASRRPTQAGVGAIIAGAIVLLLLWVIAPEAVARGFQRIVLLRTGAVTGGAAKPVLHSFAGNAAERPGIRQLSLRVVPPAYSGLTSAEFDGDAPVRALAGSRVELMLETAGPVKGATFGYAGANQPLRPAGDDQFAATLVPAQSGALEVQASTESSEPIVPVVRAIEIYPDAIPEVHLTEPATDQLWTSLPAAPVEVRWNAKDDLGLASVTLKYIKSRGAGDAATFVNGELAVDRIQRNSGTDWSGGSSIDLRRLQMQAGDTLVVWAEAHDRRPAGDGLGRSASISLALASPELAKINLDDLGPAEIAKFLLSERLILLHTEQLHGDQPRLAKLDLARRANDIANEQRDFRLSLGGFTNFEGAAGGGQLSTPNATGQTALDPGAIDQQVQDLAAERNEIHRHGIPDPPQGAPAQVRDFVAAVRAMGDAEDALADKDITKALAFVHTALTKLKSAQAAERYIPPVKAVTQPIDLKRRYAGELTDIKTRLENLARRPDPSGSGSLQASLTEAYGALSQLQSALTAPAIERSALVSSAGERVSSAAARLGNGSGDHAVTVALALGRLRIVEADLSRLNTSGTAAEFGERVETPFNLLLQATSSLFGIVEAKVQSGSGAAAISLPTQNSRSADYFRRLH